MSKSRAKKKQRQRATRAASGETRAATGKTHLAAGETRITSGNAATTPRGAPAGGSSRKRPYVGRNVEHPVAATAPASPRPSRLEIRDGVPRPDAIWAPFPLTEIGMGVGIVMFLIGFAGAPALLLVGIGVLVVVVSELCLREHFAGFRSHSVLLALLPVTIVHVAVVLVVSDAWRGLPALAVDLVVAGTLAGWLQQRFRRAQRRARLAA